MIGSLVLIHSSLNLRYLFHKTIELILAKYDISGSAYSVEFITFYSVSKMFRYAVHFTK
jgi:hypothetical protein